MYSALMVYGAPTRNYAIALAIVAGALLAAGSYAGGAICACLALVLYALARFAAARGDDDRHTLW
jgi:hypothetical protein